MKTNDILKILADENLDLQTHQYCNCFCKYCPVTDKCANFIILRHDLEWGKPQKQSFMIHGNVLNERFLYTMERVIDFADKIGFDLDGIVLQPVNETEVDKNLLLVTAFKCANKSRTMLPDALEVYEETQAKVKTKLVKAITKSRSKRKVAELYISIEYIEFLSAVIPGKLAALFAKSLGSESEKRGVGRMIIDSIMQILCAWDIILDQIPNSRDKYMELLLDYYWVMASVSASFPEAGKFQRKGLDNSTELAII